MSHTASTTFIDSSRAGMIDGVTNDLVYYECIEGTKDDVKLPIDYQAGREAASADMLVEGFDLHTALRSFEDDPADSPYQEGYLRELEEAVSGHA